MAGFRTEYSGRTKATDIAIKEQSQDEDFVLDQGISTGETDRAQREEDRKLISKANGDANIRVSSEYLRRDRLSDIGGPLDMGILATSDLKH